MTPIPAFTLGNVVVLITGLVGIAAAVNGIRIADLSEVLFGAVFLIAAWGVASLGGPIV